MFHRRKSGTGSDPPGLLFLPPVAIPTTRHFGRTSFSFSEPEADKDKEAKRNPLTHRIFSQAPHSFFSQSTGKNGQVARLDLAGFACNLHTFGSYSTQKSCMKSVLSPCPKAKNKCFTFNFLHYEYTVFPSNHRKLQGR